MSYQVELNIVDVNSGEILTKNKRTTITTEFQDTPEILYKWIDCFYRGLLKGKQLAIQITSKSVQLPVQMEMF